MEGNKMSRENLWICTLIAVFCLSSVGRAADVNVTNVADDKPPYYMTDKALDESLEIDTKIEQPEELVRVIYFHRSPGCSTCQKMSKYVYQTIKTRFAKEVAHRQLVLRYRNFEDPKNAVLVQRLKIKSPSLAILWIKDGKPVKAKLATKIWSLAGEKDKFFDYVQEEIGTYLQESEKK